MPAPAFENFTAAELTARAGGDPWALNDEIQTGQPDAINSLAEAFFTSSGCVTGIEYDFALAKKKFEQGWRRNGDEHPINGSAEVSRATTGLGLQRRQLAQIAASLEEIAAALASAQLSSDADVEVLNKALYRLDDMIATARSNGDDEIEQKIRDGAVDATKLSVTDLKKIRETYIAAMSSAEAAMQAQGYVPDLIDPVDGDPRDAAGSEAENYEQFYLAADEATVRAANADSPEVQAAAARLRDYNTITDPATSAEARRLAGERLNDYRMSNFVGPLPVNGVTGEDARERARARLECQQLLERRGVLTGRHVTPDQVTQSLDTVELEVEAMIVERTKAQLQRAGMSSEGANQFVEAVRHGTLPKEYVDAISAGGKVLDSSQDALNKYAEKVPTGRHWLPDIAYTAEDIAVIEKVAKRCGMAGTVIGIGVGVYDIMHGASLLEVGTKAGGALAGAWALGELGAAGGAIVGGPPGALIGGLVLGTLGAFGGERLADSVYKEMTGN